MAVLKYWDGTAWQRMPADGHRVAAARLLHLR